MGDGTDDLIRRWNQDPDFRDKMRSDPESAVQEHGVPLDDEELELVRQLEWKRADDELREGAKLGIIHPMCSALLPEDE